jgi:hypothetical protein
MRRLIYLAQDIVQWRILVNTVMTENKSRGSHDGENVDVGLLGCNAMRTCRQKPAFRGNHAFLKMEAICSSKTLVLTYKFTQHYNPEDIHRHGNHYGPCAFC